jgi:hypothetical protein
VKFKKWIYYEMANLNSEKNITGSWVVFASAINLIKCSCKFFIRIEPTACWMWAESTKH